MKVILRKVAAVLGTATVMISCLAGCGSTNEGTTNKTQNETVTQETTAEETADETTDTAETAEDTETLSGTITMAGSTSMEKLANAVAEAFMEKYPNVTVTAEFTGSSAGVESVIAGSVDIGNASRNLKDSEIQAGAIENVVAIDGIAVIVDPTNTVTGLTKEQLIGIYKGKIRNWSEVSGPDMPIVVVGREAGSGTRGAFEEILEIEDACVYANEIDSTGAVMAKVASIPGAIGYVSLDVLNDTVIALPLEGVEPTAQNIKAGNYILSRPFVMATTESAAQNANVEELFNYLSSKEGKELIESVGLITVD